MKIDRPDTGRLLLRLTAGGLLFLHGWFKVFVDIEGIKQMVADAGLPPWAAYGAVVGEFVAPALVIAGWKARLAGLVIAFNMLASVLIAHRDIMFSLNDYGAWSIELNVAYMMMGIVIFFVGSGRYSVSGGRGRWN